MFRFDKNLFSGSGEEVKMLKTIMSILLKVQACLLKGYAAESQVY